MFFFFNTVPIWMNNHSARCSPSALNSDPLSPDTDNAFMYFSKKTSFPRHWHTALDPPLHCTLHLFSAALSNLYVKCTRRCNAQIGCAQQTATPGDFQNVTTQCVAGCLAEGCINDAVQSILMKLSALQLVLAMRVRQNVFHAEEALMRKRCGWKYWCGWNAFFGRMGK